jgi:hypothetical protein
MFSVYEEMHASLRGRAVSSEGLIRLDADIVGSNSARSMDVFPRLSMLC